MNSSYQKTLTHTYDGKLQKSKQTIENNIQRASKISKKDKVQAFIKLRNNLIKYKEFTPQIQRCFDVIYNTFSQKGRTKSANYDPTNDLYADDLLYLCYEKVFESDSNDFSKMLILQLEDMVSGLCAQGRTTRLLQVLLAFES